MGQSGYLKVWTEYKKIEIISDEALCFVFNGNKPLMKIEKERPIIPTVALGKCYISDLTKSYYMGELEGRPCFAAFANQEVAPCEDFFWGSLMELVWGEDKTLHFLAIKAYQLLSWDRNTTFCGCCGSKNERKTDERAKICPNCGHLEFPRLSPAIIVGVKKDKELLMAHNAQFKEGLYSIIAGYVEQGETLEEAVRREVYEEVGIQVKHIKYFESKPWTNTDTIMLGFTAEYAGGEIKPDGIEIIDAGWYTKDHLPPVLPTKITTARSIIDYLLELQ